MRFPRRKTFVSNSCVVAQKTRYCQIFCHDARLFAKTLASWKNIKKLISLFYVFICTIVKISCTLEQKVMKNSYHICLSGGDEVLFRTEEDYNRAFNCLALAGYESDSSLMAEAIMSTHLHLCARTESPEELARIFRYPYARYFNSKYKRRGRLGERVPFVIQLDGLYHHLSALSYTLRNPVHHGVALTPFAYPHSSACALFRHALGRNHSEDCLQKQFHTRYLPSRAEYPDSYKMNSSGVFVRESVIDTSDVEHMFSSPRSFLYYMNRLSGEEWMREQEKDGNNRYPITLEHIESGINMNTLHQMLSNENGRFDGRAMTDIQLCELIDMQLLPMYGVASVYELSRNGKERLGNYLYSTYKLSKSQVSRCLAY